MSIEWPHFAAMIRAIAAFATRLAIRPVSTFVDVPIAGIIRTVEAGNAVEIITEPGWWRVNQGAGTEIVAPGIAVNAIT